MKFERKQMPNGRWRRRRGDVARSKTFALKRLASEQRAQRVAGGILQPPVDVDRPRTRGECKDGARPCPFVGCRHHLYLDVNPETGSIKINFPQLEPWELASSCSLDVAEEGDHTLEAVGELLNLTRERVRQIEVRTYATEQIAELRKEVAA